MNPPVSWSERLRLIASAAEIAEQERFREILDASEQQQLLAAEAAALAACMRVRVLQDRLLPDDIERAHRLGLEPEPINDLGC